MCLRTVGKLNKLLDGEYHFGIFGPAKYKKVRTKNYPLCYDMIAIDRYKHGVEHRSGAFDELISYLYSVNGSVKMISRIMTFTVAQPGANGTTTRYLFTCFQRENYKPCNGPMTIRNQLLPEMIMEKSAMYGSRDRSLCHVDGYNNRIRCKSRKGCFDFHTVHGIRMRGCIDKIPKIVAKMPNFRLLYTCYNHVWVTKSERTRCMAESNLWDGRTLQRLFVQGNKEVGIIVINDTNGRKRTSCMLSNSAEPNDIMKDVIQELSIKWK
ncbi:hypothetical protein LOAG_14535 [Loa loa]|nr:hypothetical protein LOAG_14535 [Loa loa]EFO13991.1 hypothetical protein LOAG_14535 [Loa loa]